MIIQTGVFFSCDNIIFDGDILKEVSEGVTVTYQFYEYETTNSTHQDVTYQIGRQATSADFPVFTHEDTLLVGWRYLKRTIWSRIWEH